MLLSFPLAATSVLCVLFLIIILYVHALAFCSYETVDLTMVGNNITSISISEEKVHSTATATTTNEESKMLREKTGELTPVGEGGGGGDSEVKNHNVLRTSSQLSLQNSEVDDRDSLRR